MFKLLDEKNIILNDEVIATAKDRETALRICTLLNFVRHFPDESEDIKTDLSANLISLIEHAKGTIKVIDSVMYYADNSEIMQNIRTDLKAYKELMERFKFSD